MEEKDIVLPQKLMDELSQIGEDEKKLDRLLSFMQEMLEGKGALHFREFWEARKAVLELFKSRLHPADRVRLWTRYSELCQEAKQLKELFEEESSYITEQVERAIEAVEEEMDELVEKAQGEPEKRELSESLTLHSHEKQYSELQNALTYLNSFATRLSSLKKEVVHANIHPKHRHRLLDRLRKIGDRVYPKRKEHIEEVSTLFMQDVENFIQKRFASELSTRELLDVREEIKRLQGLSKVLTLSTKAFTTTRVQLSECWENVKRVLQEHKKIQHEQKETFRKHKDELLLEIEQLQKEHAEGNLHEKEVKKRLNRISSRMRTLSLAHKDVKFLKEKIADFEQEVRPKEKAVSTAPDLRSKHKEELMARASKLLETQVAPYPPLEAARGKQDTSVATKGRLSNLAKEQHEVDCFSQPVCKEGRGQLGFEENGDLFEQFLELIDDADKIDLTNMQRVELDQELVKVRDRIEEKANKEESLDLLERLKESSKEQLEIWRRVKGASSNDFTLEMAYSDLMEKERARQKRIEEEIES